MRARITTALDLAACVSATAGAYLLLGIGCALIVAAGAALVASWSLSRGGESE